MAPVSLSPSVFLARPRIQESATDVNDCTATFGSNSRVRCCSLAAPFVNFTTSSAVFATRTHREYGEITSVSGKSLRGPKMRRMLPKNANKRKERIISVNTVMEALSDRIHSKQWREALQVFEMLRHQPFYEPKEKTYMKLIALLGNCRQPHLGRQIFDTMVEELCGPTAKLYNALIKAYCQSNLIDEAILILDQMNTLPHCHPNALTYHTLIAACADDSRFGLINSLYEQMTRQQITPNTITQNLVLHSYWEAGKYDEIEMLLSEMLKRTTSMPDVRTMNMVLSLFGRTGQIESLEKWYLEFRGSKIKPDARTFNILISAYAKKRLYDKMTSMVGELGELSFSWTASTYNSVIEAFSDAGDAEHMEHTFDQMRDDGIRADTKTFCCLIKGYAKVGLFHKVVSCVQLAGKLGIPENNSFYNAVIAACAKAGDMILMERVFKRMKEKDYQPDLATYAIMEEAYEKKGMDDRAFELGVEKQSLVPLASPSQVQGFRRGIYLK